MKLSDFLHAVVPEGHIILARLVTRTKPGGESFQTFSHTVTKTHDQALEAIRAMVSGEENIYFALASFKQGFHTNDKGKRVCRVRANVKALKALWFDIDFKSGLSDQERVVAALEAFCSETGMPAASILVHSGNGIHAYWPLEKEISYDEWKPLADGLKSLATNHGLAADLACTGDSCRVLRPPGTKNWKDPEHPKPVYFIRCTDRLHTVDELRHALVKADSLTVPAHLNKLLQMGGDLGGKNAATPFDEFTGSSYECVTTLFRTISERCPVSEYYLRTGGRGCDEPEWTAALQLLRFCADGEDYIHKVSAKHPTYSSVDTERKFEQRKENDAGPTTCKHFALFRPSICGKCPHHGKIKSPIVLGANEAPVPVAQKATVTLLGWKRIEGNSGMQRLMLHEKTGKQVWEKVLRDTWYIENAQRSEIDGSQNVTLVRRLGEAHPITIDFPTSYLGNDTKMRELLATYGAPLLESETRHFKALMATWLGELQKARQVEDTTSQLGWTHTSGESRIITGFATAGVTYMSDGKEHQGVQILGTHETLIKAYRPKGKLPPWQEVAAFLAEQNNPALTTILASAFASPLLRFTGVPGGILAVVSQESARGKTSALRCAQAVWGSPTVGMNSVDDTRLSVASKLGFLNNLPAYWDELRGEETMHNFLTLAFQISQGKEKTRLDSSAKMRHINSWETMLIAASNESIFDHMGTHSAGSDAGIARAFEVKAGALKTDKSPADIQVLFSSLQDNYGSAGQVYAKYLAENHKKLRVAVETTLQQVGEKVNQRPAERFWVSMVAVLIVGAKVASDLRLVHIDLPTLTEYLFTNIRRLRIRAKDSMIGTTPQELLTSYLQRHQTQGLIVKEFKKAGNSEEVVVRSPPQGGRLTYELGEEERPQGSRVRVLKTDFVTWLRESQKISFNSMKHRFESDMGLVQTKAIIGCGTRWSLPRATLLEMNTEANEDAS